jgi:hypothetical protein
MYRVVYWRLGVRHTESFDTLEDAKREFELISNFGYGFPECIMDENDVIVVDGKKGVIGINHKSRIGEVYDGH